MHFSNNLKILGDICVPDVKQMLEEKFFEEVDCSFAKEFLGLNVGLSRNKSQLHYWITITLC